MDNTIVVLLIQERNSSLEIVHGILDQEQSIRLQLVNQHSTALARLAGGGVNAVLLDITGSDMTEKWLAFLRKLQSCPQEFATIVLCQPEQENLARELVREGATDYVDAGQCEAQLVFKIRAAAGNSRTTGVSASAWDGSPAVLGFAGVKGGVGTTSVALNVAAALASKARVLMTELQPTASLSFYFQPGLSIQKAASVPGSDGAPISAKDAQDRLWVCRCTPGLNILFGAQAGSAAWRDDARAVVMAAAPRFDFVVLDAGSQASAAESLTGCCASLALVLERDPICISQAKIMLQQIDTWSGAPRLVGLVVVNRAPLFSPMPLSEIERELGLPLLGVIPPAPDLFLAAQRARQPLVTFQPESTAAGSLITLGRTLAAQAVLPSNMPGTGRSDADVAGRANPRRKER